jgi:hypothetical protein
MRRPGGVGAGLSARQSIGKSPLAGCALGCHDFRSLMAGNGWGRGLPAILSSLAAP